MKKIKIFLFAISFICGFNFNLIECSLGELSSNIEINDGINVVNNFSLFNFNFGD